MDICIIILINGYVHGRSNSLDLDSLKWMEFANSISYLFWNLGNKCISPIGYQAFKFQVSGHWSLLFEIPRIRLVRLHNVFLSLFSIVLHSRHNTLFDQVVQLALHYRQGPKK